MLTMTEEFLEEFPSLSRQRSHAGKETKFIVANELAALVKRPFNEW